jgi:hypothetical protein
MIRPIILGEMVQNNQKAGFLSWFGSFWGHLATPKWTKKVFLGPQVSKMYGPMSKL